MRRCPPVSTEATGVAGERRIPRRCGAAVSSALRPRRARLVGAFGGACWPSEPCVNSGPLQFPRLHPGWRQPAAPARPGHRRRRRGRGGTSPRCVQLAAASPYAARHRFGMSLSVHSGRQEARARRLPTPCHSQRIAHRGPCGKTRVVLQSLQPKPEPADIRDSRSRCAFCRRVGLAGRRTARGTRGCGCGQSVRRCGCAPPDCAEQLAEMQRCRMGGS